MAPWTPQELVETLRRARIVRVLLVYLGACFACLEAVDLISQRIGLPDWIFAAAVVLLIVGLPIILATAFVQGSPPPTDSAVAGPAAPPRETAETAQEVAEAARGWLTWRRAILGGLLAFALLGVGGTAYMIMRVTGIGPVGSLVAKGVIDAQEPIILADFTNHTGDPQLGVVATEAFRIDLTQSSLVSVMPTEYLNEALNRMEKDPSTPIDRELARELALREGVKAYIAGEIGGAGGSFFVAAELVSAASGNVLAAFRETAADSTAILGAIDRLSRKLRERAGESLRDIRSNEPLERVTTGSLAALTKYSQAARAIDVESDNAKGIALLEEAIALDSAFAMAYGRLGMALWDEGERAQGVDMLTRAYDHRDRLTDRERYLTVGIYYDYVTFERDKAITAYKTLLDEYPDDVRGLLGLASLYGSLRDYGRMEELLSRGTAADSSLAVCYPCLIEAQVAQGELDAADATSASFERNVPGNPMALASRSILAAIRGDFDTAVEAAAQLKEKTRGSPYWQGFTSSYVAVLYQRRGQLAQAEQELRSALGVVERGGIEQLYLDYTIQLAFIDLWFRGEREGSVQQVDAALQKYPLDSLAPLDRPYLNLAGFYAYAGYADRARATLTEFESAIAPELRRYEEPERHEKLGLIALAEERPADAIVELRQYDEGTGCTPCALTDLGRAYDLAGQPDSAIAVYERYLATPWIVKPMLDAYNLPIIYERLGALYAERGDLERAIYYYGKMSELWDRPDPGLEPRVEAARRAASSLAPDR